MKVGTEARGCGVGECARGTRKRAMRRAGVLERGGLLWAAEEKDQSQTEMWAARLGNIKNETFRN